jgi:hypothetical protein
MTYLPGNIPGIGDDGPDAWPPAPEFRRLPVLGSVPACGPREIYVVRGGGGPGKPDRFFRELRSASGLAARNARLADPVAIVRKRLGDRDRYTFSEIHPFSAMGVEYHAIAGYRGFDLASVKPDWRDALSRHRKGLKAHQGDGLHAIMSPTRLVAAHVRTVPLPRGVEAMVRVYIVDDRGVLSCCEVRGSPLGAQSLGIVAMEAYLGGFARLDTPACRGALHPASRNHHRVSMRAALGCFFDEPGTEPDEAKRNLRAALSHRLDLPLAHAVARSAHPEATLDMVLSDPSKAPGRREFCLTWPALASCLLQDGVLQAGDSGAETLPRVAEALRVSIPIARRLVGWRGMPSLMGLPELLSRRPGNRTYAPSEFLAAIGHDRIPRSRDREAWVAFCRVSDGVAAIMGRARADTARVPVEDAVRLVLGGGKSWQARAASMQAVAPALGRLADAGDMVRALARWLTALHGDADAALAFRIMARHGSLVRIKAASDRWHAMPELAALGVKGGDIAWPVPFGPVGLGDGWSATVLADGMELRSEGLHGIDPAGMAGLGHCVGGYAQHCQTGQSLIVSLRRMTGGATARVSTVELAPSRAGDVRIADKTYRVVQHRAARNAKPPEEAEARLGDLFAKLSMGEVPIDAEALEIRPAVETRPLTRDEAVALHPAWLRVLPRCVAVLGYDDLVALLAGMECGMPRALDQDEDRRPRRHGGYGRIDGGLGLPTG